MLRKFFDDFLHWLMPSLWVPLYSSVSFTCMPYKKCIENRAWQDRVLNKVLKIIGVTGVATLTVGAFHLYKTYWTTLENMIF